MPNRNVFGAMSGIVVVKLGGSAISVKTRDKSKACTPRLGVIHRALDAIAEYREPLVLLHGGGSFAHPFIGPGMKKDCFRKALSAVSEVELNLDQLTRIIGVGLLLRNRPFVPIHPMSFLTLNNDTVASHFLAPIAGALSSGMIPLVHGDIAVDERGGFGVVSADHIASIILDKMEVSRVLFGCDVDGVYDSHPRKKNGAKLVKKIDKTNSFRILKGLKGESGDVTGGMHGKVEEALKLAENGVESTVFNLTKSSNLRDLLNGSHSIGTRIVAWKREPASRI
ncbi:MAG TPA: isopentenyl phosphate kinase [Candidatus Bathyarchaeia archaeon]|nr:isopentenyl phosphate kinase [Candidatus Bathyarchaeia archaeon]